MGVSCCLSFITQLPETFCLHLNTEIRCTVAIDNEYIMIHAMKNAIK